MDSLYFVITYLLYYFQSKLLNGMYTHVSYYEYLSYDSGVLQKEHNIFRFSRPAFKNTKFIKLHFYSHGRNFALKLIHDDTVFHPDFVLEGSRNNRLKADISHLYHGSIVGKEQSLVHGSIIGGVFRGVIEDADEGTYYVEENTLFFRGSNISMKEHFQKGHSVIYHERAIKFPKIIYQKAKFKQMTHKYTGATERLNLTLEKQQKKHILKNRSKRQVIQRSKTTCLLYIHTDHLFYELVGSTIELVLSRVAEHVKRASIIFGRTQFKSKSGRRFRNINFKVSKVQVNDSFAAADPFNPFRFHYIGVEKYLELLSRGNYDRYCLSYAFTSHDFDDGVLGLAWVARADGSGGGICELHRTYVQNEGKQSLNTGLITFVNYGSSVPSFVTHLTFSHELGHSMGAMHDSTPGCVPGGSQGNYIMHARSTSGLLPNNRKFSPCSREQIGQVLQRKINRCFVPPNFPICGNQLIDDGEECDCGFLEDCLKNNDFCCNPADTRNECRLKPQAQCSLSQGSCCTHSCQLKSSSEKCLEATECRTSEYCNGKDAACPNLHQNAFEENPCQNFTKTCSEGECTGSICLAHQELEPCSCLVKLDASNEEKKVLCHVCCQFKGRPQTCSSSGSTLMKAFFINGPIILQPGSACGNFNGYCDIFSRCRLVDADGPLSRVTQAIFSAKLYKSIFAWIQIYWWAVCMLMFTMVGTLTLFVKVCTVDTPSHYLPVTKRFSDLRSSIARPIHAALSKRKSEKEKTYDQYRVHEQRQKKNQDLKASNARESYNDDRSRLSVEKTAAKPKLLQISSLLDLFKTANFFSNQRPSVDKAKDKSFFNDDNPGTSAINTVNVQELRDFAGEEKKDDKLSYWESRSSGGSDSGTLKRYLPSYEYEDEYEDVIPYKADPGPSTRL